MKKKYKYTDLEVVDVLDNVISHFLSKDDPVAGIKLLREAAEYCDACADALDAEHAARREQ